ncbi:MAG: hypothetical protein CM1200mP27_01590 [Chloroflexota bacterium]|nr:MAG: hypothetical protein CM1200mP27_01590 [Chloroflexota bacterium]
MWNFCAYKRGIRTSFVWDVYEPRWMGPFSPFVGASQLGWVFLIFLAIGVIVPFVILFGDTRCLRAPKTWTLCSLERRPSYLITCCFWQSRSSHFGGTVYPLISRLTTNEEITVARPFYDQVNGPLMLALVLLMGVGPLIPWRKAGLANVRKPNSARRGRPVTVGILAILGLHKDYALIGFGLSAFVTTGILMEWYRGTRSRRRSSKESYVTAFIRLIMANRPR